MQALGNSVLKERQLGRLVEKKIERSIYYKYLESDCGWLEMMNFLVGVNEVAGKDKKLLVTL